MKKVERAMPSAVRNGYILLECIVALVLLGFLMPIFGQLYHVSHDFLQSTVRHSTALQSRHYIQFVLREDMKQALSLSQIGSDFVLHTAVGNIAYTLEGEVLKRRLSGQTIRLNPDLGLRCFAMTMTTDSLVLQLETNMGIVVVGR